MDLNKIVVELHELLTSTDGLNLDKRLAEIEKKELPELFKYLNNDEQAEVLRLFSRRYGWIVPTRVQLSLQGGMRKMAMSSDDKYVAWIQSDGKLLVWSLEEEKSYIAGIKVGEHATMKFSYDHHYLYVADEGKLQLLVVSRNWEVEREVMFPTGKKVLDITVIPGDKHLVIQLETGILVLERDNQWASIPYGYVGTPESFPNKLTYSEDGTFLSLISNNQVQNIELGRKIVHPVLADPNSVIIQVIYSPNSHLIMLHKTNAVHIYRTDNWAVVFAHGSSTIKKIEVSPDCQYMAIREPTLFHIVDPSHCSG